MSKNNEINSNTVCIRVERRVTGGPTNFGHDMDYFGLFFSEDKTFKVRSFNGAIDALALVGGLSFPDAEALVRSVAENDLAYEVGNGIATNLDN
jgi:hypothetical protein